MFLTITTFWSRIKIKEDIFVLEELISYILGVRIMEKWKELLKEFWEYLVWFEKRVCYGAEDKK